MDIRWIRPEELPQLLALYRHLHPEGWLEDGPRAAAVWEAISATPWYRIVVAEEGGELVSSCTLLLVPNLTHGGRPYGLIENVVTRPDCRNRGLATACLEGLDDGAIILSDHVFVLAFRSVELNLIDPAAIFPVRLCPKPGYIVSGKADVRERNLLSLGPVYMPDSRCGRGDLWLRSEVRGRYGSRCLRSRSMMVDLIMGLESVFKDTSALAIYLILPAPLIRAELDIEAWSPVIPVMVGG